MAEEKPDTRARAGANEPRPISVDDPEKFAQTERMRQIYAAREDFQQARAEAPRLRREEEWSLPQYENHIHNAVQRYFFEVEGLMRRHPKGDRYLEDVPLGAVRPASDQDEELGPEEKGVLKEIDNTQEDDRVFRGLESLAENYRPMETGGYATEHDQGKVKDASVLVTVPVSVSLKGFRKINEFLALVGLDADMEGDSEEAEFDYSDLLQEGKTGGEKPEIATDGEGGNE